MCGPRAIVTSDNVAVVVAVEIAIGSCGLRSMGRRAITSGERHERHAFEKKGKRRAFVSTAYLDERDEDDEERRRTARVAIRVVLALPFVREELVGDYFHHSARERKRNALG